MKLKIKNSELGYWSLQLKAYSLKLLAAYCLLLTACSNNPHPPPLHEKRPDGAPWRVGYRAFPDDPRTLDPQVSYDTIGHAIISNIYETLLQYHPFKYNPYELTPCLLEEMPFRTREKDGKESYLFKLKKGLTYHDDPCFAATGGIGREVVAEDIAYVFKRIADPAVECPILSTFKDYIAGLKDSYETAQETGKFDYSKPLPGIEILDHYTFRLHLLKPYPQILYWFAMPFTAPVPHEAVEYYDGKIHDGVRRSQFRFHPVGTGPFYLQDWRRKELIRLVRFDRYHATTFPTEGWPSSDETRFRPLAGKSLPFMDEVLLPIIRESIPGWLLFRQGYLDRSGVGKDIFNTVINVSQQLTPEYRARGIQLYRDPDPSTYFMIFNMEDSVVGKNKKLRQAISCAFDEDLANTLLHNDTFLNAQQLLPPGVFGFQPNFKNPYKQHDMNLARKLLSEAGYPDGRDPRTHAPLELSFDATVDDAESRQHAEFYRSQFESLGIRVKIIENLWARQQEKFDSGHFQIIGYGWQADYPDPENFFFLFYSRNAAPQGNNYARYSNPEFDRVFETMRIMDNTPERLRLINKLNETLTEDCPWVLEFHPVLFSLNHAWAPRVSSNPLLAGGTKYTDVDMALRLKKQVEWNHPILWPIWLGLGLLVGAIGFGFCWSRRHDV